VSGIIAGMTLPLTIKGWRSSRHGRAFLTALIALSTMYTTISPATSLPKVPSYTLRYAIDFQGNKLGELEISLQHKGEKIIVRGETFPNALARMFGDGKIVETVEYIKQGQQLRLVQLVEEKGDVHPIRKALYVDRENHRVIANGKHIGLSDSEQIDAYTFPLLSILGLSDTTPGHEVKLVSAEKIRRYRYLPTEHETIHNLAGSFSTLKQSRTHMGNGKTIAIWVTESAPRLPVQIQVSRQDGHQMQVSLISIAE